MKPIIIMSLLMLHLATAEAGWFSNQEEARVAELKTQLNQEQQSKGSWQVVAFVLGVTCVITLVAGTAIGSKGRRNANERRE